LDKELNLDLVGNTVFIKGFFTIMSNDVRNMLTDLLNQAGKSNTITIDLSGCKYINSTVVSCLARYIVKHKNKSISIIESNTSSSVNSSVRTLNKLIRGNT